MVKSRPGRKLRYHSAAMPRVLLALAMLAVVVTETVPGAWAVSDPDPEPEPLRLSGRVFGEAAVLEVRDLRDRDAEAALRSGFQELRELQDLLEEARGALNADATTERAVTVSPPVVELLSRALQFCIWSEGAVGPLGGSLADHWQAVAGNPSPPPVPAELVASTACDRLSVDRQAGAVRIAAGSRVSFEPFAVGFAVDRTVEALRAAGADNGVVRVGRVQRAFGPGPPAAGGRGWPGVLPAFEGYDQPFDVVPLDERALAVEWRADWPTDLPRHVNQRTGASPAEAWATAAVTELAIDAQALAVAAMVLSPREGRYRMASLEPEPAVLWLLGRGQGRPLRRDLNWSDLHAP